MATGSAYVIRARRAILPEGERAASVLVQDGRIARIGAYDDLPAGADVVDVGDHVLLPGLVDSHVHVNEPGRTEWEGFETATRAAVAGGVTTIVDMPLNSLPPTTDVTSLERKRAAAERQAHCDVGFWGGAVPGNADALFHLHAAGALGFKAFLCDSGVPEFPPLEPEAFEAALERVAALGSVLLVHAEDPHLLVAPSGEATAHDTWLRSRPAQAEIDAIAWLIELSRTTAGRVHVVHLSASGAIEELARAKDEGVPITVETCPHYLVLEAERVPEGSTLCKCAPPIRGRANRDALWRGLEAGVIDAIVSDHSPSPPEGKKLETGDFLGAWGGIASLGLGLPLVWTEAEARGLPLTAIVRWMCEGPAAIAGLAGRKGAIAPGADADFAIFDPAFERTLEAGALAFRHKVSPYLGRRVTGVVRRTILRGETVYDAGTWGEPRGTLLTRAQAFAR
jgi:allantoinase